jgi:predicted nucleotide-binding protein
VPPISHPVKPSAKLPTAPALSAKPKVFIAHGKNPQIVNQLKDVLTFGNFDPVVAEEYETAAKPVPDKVLDLMRGCSAGIIHVASEDELLDKVGGVHHKLNENVLIEIGASMALFGRKFILLVQKGLHLPSNLSGLYCCYYEGDKLDYDATMKLLKAFGEFRTQ